RLPVRFGQRPLVLGCRRRPRRARGGPSVGSSHHGTPPRSGRSPSWATAADAALFPAPSAERRGPLAAPAGHALSRGGPALATRGGQVAGAVGALPPLSCHRSAKNATTAAWNDGHQGVVWWSPSQAPARASGSKARSRSTFRLAASAVPLSTRTGAWT